MAVKQPKKIFRGEDKTYRITIKKKSDGLPLDLTTLLVTDDIRFTVAPKPGDAETFNKTLLDGEIVVVVPHTGDNLGKADIPVAKSDTAAIVVADLIQSYDVELIFNGKRHVIVPPSEFEICETVTPPKP